MLFLNFLNSFIININSMKMALTKNLNPPSLPNWLIVFVYIFLYLHRYMAAFFCEGYHFGRSDLFRQFIAWVGPTCMLKILIMSLKNSIIKKPFLKKSMFYRKMKLADLFFSSWIQLNNKFFLLSTAKSCKAILVESNLYFLLYILF